MKQSIEFKLYDSEDVYFKQTNSIPYKAKIPQQIANLLYALADNIKDAKSPNRGKDGKFLKVEEL